MQNMLAKAIYFKLWITSFSSLEFVENNPQPEIKIGNREYLWGNDLASSEVSEPVWIVVRNLSLKTAS